MMKKTFKTSPVRLARGKRNLLSEKPASETQIDVEEN